MSLKEKRLFLLDMDGTIYLDQELFDGTLDFLDHVKKIGGRAMYLTNNSSKSVTKYIEKLDGMGIKADKKDFTTSAQATALFLQNTHKNDLIYVFGTQALKDEFIQYGLNITDKLCDEIKCLVMGFDTELSFQKLEDACILLNRGVDYIATNPDWVCPVEFGFIPDCGSMCFSIEKATGKAPVFIGKPQPEMIYAVMEKFGVAKEDTVVIGDRLYTDIASGNNAGVSTICVLSGEVTLEEVEKSTGIQKPDFVLESVSKLLK